MNSALLPQAILMLSMGFLGSLHCVGMCGGLITAVNMGHKPIWWQGLWLYQCGRITTYAILGLLVGASGTALSSWGGMLWQQLFAILAGAMMIFFALSLVGWLPDPLRRLAMQTSHAIGLARLAKQAADHVRGRNWFLLGVANGLLPCGLVYAALMLTLTATSAAVAMLMMVAFGIGTIPAMMAAPSLIGAISPAQRMVTMRVAASIMMVLGLFTLWRGL